ncbi:MAG: hypothetical protein JNL81_15240 [Hyphomonadaceae bacterium]|nr:hypothetical protein [Hyphomonadaceae bacterium]
MSDGRSVGYLFTDIDGSVAKWERSPAAMTRALARHDELIDAAVARHGGAIHDRAGDGVFAVFDGGNPLACALDLQRAFQIERWDDVGGLAIRIGIHAGAEHVDGERNRQSVNRAHRIALAAWGGQIVVSAAAAASFSSPPESRLTNLGAVYLRGIDEPQRLFSLTSADMGIEEFPPLRGVARQSPSVPSQTTSIFGRDTELADLLKLIEARHRWITITGPGGMGKTRLTLEVASKLAAERETHLVILSSGRRNARELALAIVAGLRLPRRRGVSDIDLLLEYLGDKNVLLVIDNADGVTDADGAIGAIIDAAKNVTVLATSREPFMSAQETVFKLGGLLTPQINSGFTGSPAARLFAQSAAAVDPTFKFAADDAAHFAKICEAVRGVPLALHLTAQWVAVLSLKEIAQNLTSGTGLLSKLEGGGARSLRDVFNGSWLLLSDEQRVALASLAVFPASFDAPSAEAITGVAPGTLQVLERKNLLERRSPYRFALHPLIHEFASECLKADSALASLQKRHSEYYLARVDEYFAASFSTDQPKIAERIRAEYASMAAAWSFAARSRANKALPALAERTFYLYTFGAMFSEALEIFSGTPADAELLALFQALRANCLIQLARYDDAADVARQVVAKVRIGNRRARGHAHQALANGLHATCDWANAEKQYNTALGLRPGDHLGQFYTVLSLAWLAVQQGRPSRAKPWLQRSQALCDKLNYVGGAMLVRTCAGALAASAGDNAKALELYQAAIALEPVVDNGQASAALRCRIAELELKTGDIANADKSLNEALQLATAAGDVRNVVRALTGLGAVARKEPTKARALMMDALSRGVAHSVSESDIAAVLIALAYLEAEEKRIARAGHLVAIATALGVAVAREDRKRLGGLGVDLRARIVQLSAQEAISLLLEEYKSLAR